MRFKFKNKETTSFKKRFNSKIYKIKLKFGFFAFILTNATIIEYNYVAYFKKMLKTFFKFKKTKFKKVWIFLNKNFPLTKKSKNSRMGKGKGKINRYVIRVANNYTLFEFLGFSVIQLFKIKTLFNFKLKSHVYLYMSFFLRKNQNIFNRVEYNFKVKYFNL